MGTFSNNGWRDGYHAREKYKIRAAYVRYYLYTSWRYSTTATTDKGGHLVYRTT